MTSTAFEPCRICGGLLEPAFPGQVLGYIPVIFHHCNNCGSLLLPSPHWLEEAYAKSIVPNPDQGSLARTLFVHRCIRRLRSRPIQVLPKHFRSLDVGAGRGFLLRLLLDEGQDSFGYDPHPIPVLAEHRVFSEFPPGTFQLLTAIEMLEHTLDPIASLSQMRDALASNGILLLSTELYVQGQHGPDWYYLAPEHGQHITIFSRKGLMLAAGKAGLRWVTSFAWSGRPFLHLLVREEVRYSPLSSWILQWRHQKGEKRIRRDQHV